MQFYLPERSTDDRVYTIRNLKEVPREGHPSFHEQRHRPENLAILETWSWLGRLHTYLGAYHIITSEVRWEKSTGKVLHYIPSLVCMYQLAILTLHDAVHGNQQFGIPMSPWEHFKMTCKALVGNLHNVFPIMHLPPRFLPGKSILMHLTIYITYICT